MLCSLLSLAKTHQKRERALPLWAPDESDVFSLMSVRVIHPAETALPAWQPKSWWGCVRVLTRELRVEGVHEWSRGQVCQRGTSHTLWSWIAYSSFIKSLTGHHLTGVKLPAAGGGGGGGATRVAGGANRDRRQHRHPSKPQHPSQTVGK